MRKYALIALWFLAALIASMLVPPYAVSTETPTAPQPIQQPVIVPEPKAVNELDYDALAYAVARQESGGCTSNVARRHNNCHGIRVCFDGSCPRYRDFQNTEESHAYFKDLWRRKYGRFPDLALAARYSSEGAAPQWLANVTLFYTEFKQRSKVENS